MEEESWKSNHGGIWEASGRQLEASGGNLEVSGKHLERPGRLLEAVLWLKGSGGSWKQKVAPLSAKI